MANRAADTGGGVSRFDDLAHSGHLMGGEIVDNDPVAGSTFLQQDMSDIGGEHLAVDHSIKDHRAAIAEVVRAAPKWSSSSVHGERQPGTARLAWNGHGCEPSLCWCRIHQ